MIPFCDLKKVNEKYRQGINRAIADVLDSGWYIRGNNCLKFEEKFSRYCESKYCIGVGNGLDALKLIILGLGLGEGDEVLVPANTFIATFLAVTDCGCKVVPVDIKDGSYNLDVNDVKNKITPKTKAVIAVHLYGVICEMDELLNLCEINGLYLIEDAAQAHGARYKGRKAGSFGVASAFSFYPGKNLGALGDAGAVVTNDAGLAKKINSLSSYGAAERYIHKERGVNSRLDELQAAVLSVKLEGLDEDNERRRLVANLYLEGINNSAISLPVIDEVHEPVWHQFIIATPHRSELQSYLGENGVETLIHYPIPCHKQKAYPELNREQLPNAEGAAKKILSLPISPVQDSDTTMKIVSLINAWKI